MERTYLSAGPHLWTCFKINVSYVCTGHEGMWEIEMAVGGQILSPVASPPWERAFGALWMILGEPQSRRERFGEAGN
jgi:hypothetical protein